MDEYLNTVIEQIRCKAARPFIEEELRGHIEDQIEDNVASGMGQEEAVKCAVADMGDPVETGMSLDRIHRPQIAWGMLALVAVVTIIAMFIHIAIGGNGEYSEFYLSRKAPVRYLEGLFVMVFVYWIDYTFIARFAKPIALFMVLFSVYGMINGVSYNGYSYVKMGWMAFSIKDIMLLYIPVYACVLYQYRGTSVKGLLKALLWMIIPVLAVFRMPALTTSMIMFVSMLTLITIAILKDWFIVPKGKMIAVIWGFFIGLPALLCGLFFNILFYDYQKDRIKSIFATDNVPYITKCIRNIISASKLTGNSGEDVMSTLPGFNSDYILTYITSTYGLLALILAIASISIMLVGIFGIALRQKNQLGMMIAVGSGMVILMNMVINVLENIGRFPPTSTFFPFISAGGCSLITCYILIGIVLSVYRYKTIYPSHVRINYPKIKIEIKL